MIKEEKSNEVMDSIVLTAKELFINKGLKGTTIRDIATASGTNVAMVNYYFRSKNNLFEAIFDEAFETVAGGVFSAIDSDLPFFEMIRKWVYFYFDTLMENPQLPFFVMHELSQNPSRIETKLKEKNSHRIYKKLEVRIREEEAKGTIRKIETIDFLLNIVSLSIFPFVFRPILTAFSNVPYEYYQKILKNHKESVVEFIINAIKV
jgi:AcrR family transcriptional regulator